MANILQNNSLPEQILFFLDWLFIIGPFCYKAICLHSKKSPWQQVPKVCHFLSIDSHGFQWLRSQGLLADHLEFHKLSALASDCGFKNPALATGGDAVGIGNRKTKTVRDKVGPGKQICAGLG
jgi:hypothetical protein